MAYSNAHLLCTFGGTSWEGNETWQYGLRLAGSVPPTTAQMTGLKNAATTYHTSAGGKFTANAQLTWVKVANQTTEGLYLEDVDAELLEFAPVSPSHTGVTFPQITLCVSLVTARTRGLAHGGRFYPPPTTHGPVADGRISEALLTSYLTAAKDFVNAVNAVGLGRVTVYSRGKLITPAVKGVSPAVYGTGAQNEVTGVRCGRVFDTQRRRRSSLLEQYQVAAVTP